MRRAFGGARLAAGRGLFGLAQGAQDEAAGLLARQLAAVPERRVAEVMATPLRGAVLSSLFWGLPRVLGRTSAHEIATAIRFRVTNLHGDPPDEYVLVHRNRRWRCTRDGATRTELTITASGADLLALSLGRAAPMRHYASGRLRVRGNPVAAARLLTVIRAQLRSETPAGG